MRNLTILKDLSEPMAFCCIKNSYRNFQMQNSKKKPFVCTIFCLISTNLDDSVMVLCRTIYPKNNKNKETRKLYRKKNLPLSTNLKKMSTKIRPKNFFLFIYFILPEAAKNSLISNRSKICFLQTFKNVNGHRSTFILLLL